MKRGIVNIVVPKTFSQDDIKALREQYKECCCRVNIFVSGDEEPEQSIKNLIMARVNS